MDMLDHLIVIKDNELKTIVGGLSVSGTLIKAMSSAVNTIMEVGRSLGTAIRKLSTGKLC